MRTTGEKRPVSKKVVRELNEFEIFLVNSVKSGVPEVAGPSLEAIRAGGKRLRPALVVISASFGKNVDKEILRAACAAVELVHLASLIHDDVLDGAKTRRGISTISAKCGHGRAVCIGDYLFGLAFELLAESGNNSLIDPLATASVHLSEGELRQRQDLRRLDQSIEDYLERTYAKTAALFVAACLMGARLSSLSQEIQKTIEEYAAGLGIAFQIYDDILDFTGDEAEMGKPVGSDIREGTVTLPMICGLETDPNKVLSQAILEPVEDAVEKAVAHVNQCGAVEKAEKLARKYVDGAKEAADSLPDCSGRDDLLSLGNFVINRYH